MFTFTVTDNILPEVLDEIRHTAASVLQGAGMLFERVAVEQCPVSDIDDPGYIHLYETIGYEVDQESTYHQQWVTFYVIKNYAQFVNDGTSRMGPRPFFTNGVLAVSDDMDSVVRARFRDLIMGRPGVQTVRSRRRR